MMSPITKGIVVILHMASAEDMVMTNGEGMAMSQKEEGMAMSRRGEDMVVIPHMESGEDMMMSRIGGGTVMSPTGEDKVMTTGEGTVMSLIEEDKVMTTGEGMVMTTEEDMVMTTGEDMAMTTEESKWATKGNKEPKINNMMMPSRIMRARTDTIRDRERKIKNKLFSMSHSFNQVKCSLTMHLMTLKPISRIRICKNKRLRRTNRKRQQVVDLK